ncbi:MAG: 3-keto-5-aminohexanoate cleavage protein [Candidatus Lokiarchaeota archaeon]
MEKLVITAAICGAEVLKEHNPNIPYTVEEIAIEAEKSYNAGASIIHLHVREDNGTPTQDKKRFQECIEGIKEKCPDVIIMPSTGGAVGMSNEERLQPIYLKPEMASLDCGTCNFGYDEIFVNTEKTIVGFVKEMNRLGIKPELECFEKGMVDTALRLNREGIIKDPMHFNLVFGVRGCLDATITNLNFMISNLPESATFTVTGIGKAQFPINTASIIMGGHVRVGFEDNIYLSKGKLANSNGELVKKIARISRELGREIANPSETRKILGIS